MERDIIVTALSCGGKMNCKKEAALFREPPIIVSVPGAASGTTLDSVDGFIRTAKIYRAHNSVLDGFFAARNELSAVRPRRVCLVGFSAAWSWITAVLKASGDRGRIDAVLMLDGPNTSGLKAWTDYAELAAKGGRAAPKLWLAHPNKPSATTFISSQNTSTRIIRTARHTDNAAFGLEHGLKIPDFIVNTADIAFPISVFSKAETPTKKIYHKDPIVACESVGNVVRLAFEGDTIQDSIYIAQYVQPRFWQWLRQLWEDPSAGVLFK